MLSALFTHLPQVLMTRLSEDTSDRLIFAVALLGVSLIVAIVFGAFQFFTDKEIVEIVEIVENVTIVAGSIGNSCGDGICFPIAKEKCLKTISYCEDVEGCTSHIRCGNVMVDENDQYITDEDGNYKRYKECLSQRTSKIECPE